MPTDEVHPEVAHMLDIREGDLSLIETTEGKIQQHVKLNESIDPRVIVADYGWGHPVDGVLEASCWQESNINNLTSGSSLVEPIIGSTTNRGMYSRIMRFSKTISRRSKEIS